MLVQFACTRLVVINSKVILADTNTELFVALISLSVCTNVEEFGIK